MRRLMPTKRRNAELSYREGVLYPFVAQAKPQLDAIQPQHAFGANGRATAMTVLGVHRLNGLHQLGPGYEAIHVGKKSLSPGHARMQRVASRDVV